MESQICCHGCSDVAYLELHRFMIDRWLVTSSTVELISGTQIGSTSVYVSPDVTNVIRHAHRPLTANRRIALNTDLDKPETIMLYLLISVVLGITHWIYHRHVKECCPILWCRLDEYFSRYSLIKLSKCNMIHWNRNVVILTKFSSLAAPKVVKMTTFGAVSD